MEEKKKKKQEEKKKKEGAQKKAADQKTKGKFILFGGGTLYGSTTLFVMKMTFILIDS